MNRDDYRVLLDRAIAVLCDDYARQDQYLEYHDVYCTLERVGLECDDIGEVLAALAQRDIHPVEPEISQPCPSDHAGSGRRGLLTAREETQLGRAIWVARELQLAIEDGRQEATPEVEDAIRRGDEARRDFITANLRLVTWLVPRFDGLTDLDVEDLQQEGYKGLIRAVDKFDYRKGFRFSTYALHWINQTIRRGLSDIGRTIRYPGHFVDKLLKLRKAERQLGQHVQGPRVPRDLVALHLGWSVDQVRATEFMALTCKSLDAPMAKDSKTPLVELLPDHRADAPDEIVGRQLVGEYLHRQLGVLKVRQAYVVSQRFGLVDREPKTLESVGRIMGVTRERVRQLEKKALVRLSHPGRRREMEHQLKVLMGQHPSMQPTWAMRS